MSEVDIVEGVAARTDGTDEIVIPAPCAVTVYVTGGLTASGEPNDDVNSRLIVGWNASGAPIIVGDDGGLRLLEDGEAITDLTWNAT
jgi:hypothetical protein